ncbi:MAG: DUF4416 family protein [Spirochaetes bacterium]|nr:DUF4416 family protein [Spirochaetota bacterium]
MEWRQNGVARAFTPAKLIIPALLSAAASVEPVVRALEDAFGTLDYQSEEIPFTFTDYYTSEMGAGIRRLFFAVGDLYDPSELASLKLTTDELEEGFASGGRSVNLDPGMLTLGRLMLASTKDYAQRIPLRDGIYAEITLLYRQGRFEALPWTYPDYRSAAYQDVLRDLRDRYKRQLEADSAHA